MGYADDPEVYEELLADIEGGAGLHYAASESADPDLDLLAGDRRYADGLVKLAALGDLATTRVLGDAISAIALAQARGDDAGARRAWQEAVHTVRTGR